MIDTTNNTIIYDWLSYTSKIDSTFSIIETLGLSSCTFESRKGKNGYNDCLFFEGISIYYNGRENFHTDGTVFVEMSGTGCRTFEAYGTGDYDTLFSAILDHYSDDKDKREMNITRLDVAYNDFNNVLDLKLLAIETQKLNFVSRFKDWQVITGNKGLSVDHGSMRSNVYIRIYDKKLQLGLSDDECEHFVRAEIQLRRECALGFIMLNKSIQQSYFDVMNNYLHYVVHSDNNTNKCMRPFAPYWLRFLESVQKQSVFYKPAYSYNFGKLFSYVTDNMSGALQTLFDTVGVDQVVKSVKESRKGKKLNPKYQSILNQYEQHGQNILEAIGEDIGEDK